MRSSTMRTYKSACASIGFDLIFEEPVEVFELRSDGKRANANAESWEKSLVMCCKVHPGEKSGVSYADVDVPMIGG